MNSSIVLNVFTQNLKDELKTRLEYTDIYSTELKKIIKPPSDEEFILKSLRKSINDDNTEVKAYFDSKNTPSVDSLSYLKSISLGDNKNQTSIINIVTIKQSIKECIASFNATQGKQLRDSIFNTDYKINLSYDDFVDNLITVFSACIIDSTIGIVLKTDPLFKEEVILKAIDDAPSEKSTNTNINITKTTTVTSSDNTGLIIGAVILVILVIGGIIMFMVMGSGTENKTTKPASYIKTSRSDYNTPGSPRSGPVKRNENLDKYKKLTGEKKIQDTLLTPYITKLKSADTLVETIEEKKKRSDELKSKLNGLEKERREIESKVIKEIKSDEIKSLQIKKQAKEKELEKATDEYETEKLIFKKGIEPNAKKEKIKQVENKLKNMEKANEKIQAEINRIELKLLTILKSEKSMDLEKKRLEELSGLIEKTRSEYNDVEKDIQSKYLELNDIQVEITTYETKIENDVKKEEQKEEKAKEKQQETIDDILNELDVPIRSVIDHLRLTKGDVNIYTIVEEAKKNSSFQTARKDVVTKIALDKFINYYYNILEVLSRDKNEIRDILTEDSGTIPRFLLSKDKKGYILSVKNKLAETSGQCSTLEQKIIKSDSLKSLTEALNEYKSSCKIKTGEKLACSAITQRLKNSETKQAIDEIKDYESKENVCKETKQEFNTVL